MLNKVVENTQKKNKYFCLKCRDRSWIIECKCGCGLTRPLRNQWGVEGNHIHLHFSKYIEKGKHDKRFYEGYIKNDGYRKVGRPDHHFTDHKGYVWEHRLVWEQYHKACLLPWGEVHHKNISGLSEWENKHDNRPENLDAMMGSKHLSLHKKIDMNLRFCIICSSPQTRIKKNGRPEWHQFNGKDDTMGHICSKCNDKITHNLRMLKKYKK